MQKLMELRLWPIKDLWPAVLLVLHQSGVAVEVCGEEATRRGGCRRFRPALHNIKSCGVATAHRNGGDGPQAARPEMEGNGYWPNKLTSTW